MLKFAKNEQGFSLLEIILSITICAVFLSTGFIILDKGFSFLEIESFDPGLEQELEMTGLRIAHDIVRSIEIKLPADDEIPDSIELKVVDEENSKWFKYSKYLSSFGHELALQREKDRQNDEINYTRRDSILNQIEEVEFQLISDEHNYEILNIKISRRGKKGEIYKWQKSIVLPPKIKTS